MAQSTQLTEANGESLTESRTSGTRRRIPQWVPLLVLALISALPYLNTLANDFVWDDRQQILANPYVHSFRFLPKIFSTTVWAFEGAEGATNYYRPLMSLTYAIAYKLFGPHPLGFHVLNVGLPVAVVLVLFILTERLFQDRVLSLISAGLFALHPIHTESVAWIAGVTDLELTFFFLSAFLLYLDLCESGRATCWGRNLAVVVAFGLSLVAKESALALPVIVIMYECVIKPITRQRVRNALLRCLPVLITAVTYITWRRLLLGAFVPVVTRSNMPRSAVLLSAVTLTGQYMWKLIWPTHLAAFYVFRETFDIHDPRFLAAVGAVIICLGLLIWLWRHERPASFALIWIFVTLAPVLNARWMPAQVFAERYLYLPSVGFCWLAGWAVASAWQRSRTQAQRPIVLRTLVAVPVALIVLLYTAMVMQRNRDWQSDEVLYRRTLDEEPDAQLIRTSLGIVYADRGDWDSAEREWTLALGPGRPYAVTLNALGVLRQRQNRYPEAATLFTEAVELRPQYADPHRYLAEIYEEIGRSADAEHEFRLFTSLSR